MTRNVVREILKISSHCIISLIQMIGFISDRYYKLLH